MLRRALAVAAVSVTAVSLALSALAGSAAAASPSSTAPSRAPAAHPAPATYTNPVSKGFADTFADPTIIRGNDGFWYAYATADPLHPGGQRELLPTAKSADLVNWTFVGDALTQAGRPSYIEADSTYYAPDVRYINGQYVMYYVATDTTTSATDTSDSAIGVATAPTPTGPWTQASAPLIAPRPAPTGGYLSTIDPAELTASDGSRYLYYGSFLGGLFVTRLTADGLHAVGSPTMVAIDNKYEGSFVVHHGGYYYLFASSSNCCAGPTTGYAVSVGRSTSPLGPFVDAKGVSLLASKVGGTPVITQNGNRWIGTGGNSVVTDLSGQDYLVYHAIDRNDPYLDQAAGINQRPMLIDRLDWINGWPVVRAGAGASDTPQPAPVTTGPVDEAFGSAPSWLPRGWHVTDGFLTGTGEALAPPRLAGNQRVEADLRALAGSTAGLVVGGVTATLDPRAGQLILADGRGRRAAIAVPTGLDYSTWHNVAVEARGGRVTAALTEARESGPIVSVSLSVPAEATNGRVGIRIEGRGAAADNLSAAPLYRPVTKMVPQPATGRLVTSDEFNGSSLGSAWTWVRPDPAATVAGGSLNWPVENGDIAGTANDASVLLHSAPRGDYTVETKVTLDLGVTTVRNYQQAGLVAYVNDNDYASLHTVAIWDTRQVEFARELPYGGQLAFGGITVGTPAATTWLRLIKRTNATTGEVTFRGASSTDGRHWTLSGVWTFPRGSDPRIGLVSLGGATPAVTAKFDYVRFYSR